MIVAILVSVAFAVGQTGHPSSEIRTAKVDLIELNHFVDDEGREVFRQLIFYDWSESRKRFLVRSWRLVKSAEQVPKRTWKPSRHYVMWTENGSIRRVEAPQLRKTWSQKDPEKVNREFLPEDQRVPLWRVAGKTPTRR